MRIIITENQNYLLRRISRFIEIVEDQIEGYELNSDRPWWCVSYDADSFAQNLVDRSIEEFIEENWDFFHDNSDKGGSVMDISLLNRIVEENYGNHIRNLYVRKCNSRRW